MKKLVTVLMMLGAFMLPLKGIDPNVVHYLEDITVAIDTLKEFGTGVLFSRPDKDNNPINFVWTAAHVIIQNITSNPDKTVSAAPVKISKYIKRNYVDIGKTEMIGYIVKYSVKYDLALIMVDRIIGDNTVLFNTVELPDLGDNLFYMGHFGGHTGGIGLLTGIYSQHNIEVKSTLYDAIQVGLVGGCSGGGVFNTNGLCVGLAIMARHDVNLSLINPARKIIQWSKDNKVQWGLNASVPIPSLDDIRKVQVDADPVEDEPVENRIIISPSVLQMNLPEFLKRIQPK